MFGYIIYTVFNKYRWYSIRVTFFIFSSMLRASCDSLDRFIENENPYDEVPFESKVSKPFEV